jgi:hypothetical protein|tara:strand:- start:822 stop:1040 length:219 start_codon:yes stop_codon:yes gene_type:complete
MTVAAFDPRLLNRYLTPKSLLHFQWGNDTKVYRYGLVEIIKEKDIDPTLKQKKDEVGLSQKEILERKYKRKI